MKVVVITGSREFPWRRSSEIAKVLEEAQLLIVGDARGADAIARKLAVRSYIPILEIRANWQLLGKLAGPARNAKLAAHALLYLRGGQSVTCHAFPIGESPGTRGCIRIMADMGIPVVVHETLGPSRRQLGVDHEAEDAEPQSNEGG